MHPKPLINPSTDLLIKSFIRQPANTVGLNGPTGSAKLQIAKYICQEILQTKPSEFDFKVEVLDCSKDSGIEDIRSLKKSLSIKASTTEGNFGRAVIFKNFHKISIPAQNSILKLLEEPPLDTILIILVDSKNSILPTITSRLQWIDVLPISLRALQENYAHYDNDSIKQAYLLSDGYLINFENALSQQSSTLKSAIADAKQILKMKKPERISKIDNILNNQNYNPEEFLTALQRIYFTLMRKEAGGNIKLLTRVVGSLELVNNTKESLKYNANPKLVFTNLFYKI